MQVLVNGQCREVGHGITVRDLLCELEVSLPHVAVELNRDVVPRAQHAATQLAEGDEVEVVTLVGGG